MKQRRNYLFFLLFISLTWVSCEKNVVNPGITPTVVTTNTTVITTTTTVITPPIISSPIIGTVSGTDTTFYSWGVYNSYTPFRIMGGYSYISAATIELSFYAQSTGTYLLSTHNTGTFIFISSPMNPRYTTCTYNTDSIHTGTVNLTLLDTVNHLISGTFNFIGYGNCGTDTVRNGFFRDLKW